MFNFLDIEIIILIFYFGILFSLYVNTKFESYKDSNKIFNISYLN